MILAPTVGAADVTARTTEPAGAERVSSEVLLPQVDVVSVGLREVKAGLERDYGYEGSKVRVAAALSAAGISGATLARAARYSGRLYSLHGRVTPSLDGHLEAVADVRATIAGQGWLSAADAAHVRVQLAALTRHGESLRGAFDQLVALHVGTTRSMIEAARYRRDADKAAAAMGRLGTAGGTDLIAAAAAAAEEASGRVASQQASGMWLSDWVDASVSSRFVLPLRPMSDRARVAISALAWEGGPNAPKPAVAAAAPTDAAAAASAASAELAAATARQAAARARFEESRKQMEAQTLRLRLVKSARDLDSVRMLTERVASLEAEERQMRAAIAEISIESDEGRATAKQLAMRLLDVRKELPAARLELEVAGTEAAFKAWQRERRHEQAASTAALSAARRALAAASEQVAAAHYRLNAVTAAAGEAARHAARAQAAALAAAARRGPGVDSASVTSEGRVVARVERLDYLPVEAALAVATAAGAEVAAATDVLGRAVAGFRQAALAAEQRRADVDPRARLLPAGWSRAVMGLGKSKVLGPASEPALTRQLKLLAPAPPHALASLEALPTAAGKTAPDPARLAAIITVLEAIAADPPRALTGLATPLAKRWEKELTGGKLSRPTIVSLAQRELIALLFRATLPLALKALADAEGRAAAASAALEPMIPGWEAEYATRLAVDGPLVEATEVTVSVALQERGRACPEVGLGAFVIEAQPGSDGCHYRIARLPVPAPELGPQPLTFRMVPPP